MALSHFVYKLTPPRPDFPTTITEAESNVMGQHVMYWQGQLERGAALLFGPVDDPAGAWGLAIIEAGTVDDAHALAATDPAVTSGTCTYEIFPMEAIVRSAG